MSDSAAGCWRAALVLVMLSGCLEAAVYRTDAAVAKPRPDAADPNAPNYFSASPAAGASCRYPGQLLNLANWNLTLPVARSAGSSSPRTVGQSALLTFNDPRFFHPTPECDGVVFEAPCLGVTTSNSRYPRSELRELVGGKEARWNVGTGTHTMIITQAITHLPAVKREVVAGQIHDADDDVVMIRLEGRRLLVSPVGTILDSAHELGTRFTVKLVAGGGRIKVFHDDMSTPRVDIASAAVGCYFKAGVYTQSNTTTGDAPEAYGQVVIYDLQVSHQ